MKFMLSLASLLTVKECEFFKHVHKGYITLYHRQFILKLGTPNCHPFPDAESINYS